MDNRPGVAPELICTPDFKWKDTTAYQVWPGLKSISHPIPLIRRFRFIQGQFVNPLRCAQHAGEKGLDVIHFSNINHLSFPYWQKAYSRMGIKVAISVHDIKRQKEILNRRWEDAQLKAVYRFADALFVHSNFQAAELESFANVDRNKIHVVPHGPYPHGDPVNSDRMTLRKKYDIPVGKRVALFFGQMRDEKNLDGLLEAIKKGSFQDLHLVVAGKGGGKHRGGAYYHQLATRLGIEKNTTFLNRFIQDEEVTELFSLSDWVALPYKNDFTSQSGVLNIAAHYEVPVLVSSSPVLKETVTVCDIGIACEGDTDEALVDGIKKMHSRLDEDHKHAFRTYREQFSWEENASKTLKVYQSLLMDS